MRAASKWPIVPAAAITALVAIAPFVLLVWQSLFDLNYFEGRDAYLGFGNYQKLWQDESFVVSLVVTFKYALCATAASILLGILGAVALLRLERGRSFIPLLLAPFLVAPVVVALIFALLLDGQLGMVPHCLALLGFGDPENIVGHPRRIFWALVLIDAWQWFGVVALVFYTRLRQIPKRFFDLVAVSGGGRIRQLVDIWIPSMIRVVGAMVLFKVIWALGDAERTDALTAGGGPHGAMRVFSIWMERVYFRYSDYGYGASAAVVYYVVALIGAVCFVALLKRQREMT